MKLLLSLFFFALLTSCVSSTRYDTSHLTATNHDSRIQFVIVHYTSASLQRSLELLTHGEVSSHYLVGDDAAATVFKLVDENDRAWHAGESEWEGRTWLNSSSIGIEIVNPGYTDSPSGRVWYPYSEAQVQALIVLLKDVTQRNHIDPRHVLGHSDIAPQRKLDPGPMFPWKRLAQAGIGIWPDEAQVARRQAMLIEEIPSPAWFQQQLARLGYATPQTGTWDPASRQVLAAFQMHYRPERFDGEADVQSAAILQVLNKSE